MAGFENDVMVASNVNFNGAAPKPHLGIITTNGQLLIGSTASPNIRAGNITSTGGTVTVTNGSGNINLEAMSFLINSGTITSTAFKAIRTTPVVAIPAPPAGSAIIVNRFVAKFNYGGNNAFVGGGTLNLYYNNTAGAIIASNISASFYTGTVDDLYASSSSFGPGNIGNIVEGLPVVISTSSTDPTGNAANDNSFSWQIFYTIVTMP